MPYFTAAKKASQEKTAHTPGPWRPSMHYSGAEVYGGGVCVADVYGKDKRANAHLIAAAPELLEALQELRSAFGRAVQPADMREEWRPVWNKARSAIAKAKGE